MNNSPNGDKEVSQPPGDSISSLSWSPTAPFLAGTSWNAEVRIWEIAQNGDSRPHHLYKHAAPVLDCTWVSTGDKVISVGCDNKAMCQDLRSNSLFQVAQHEKPIRKCKWVKDLNVLVTLGWDKVVNFWDCRQPKPVASAPLPERGYAMDVTSSLMVVATAERKIGMFDCKMLGNPRFINSPLKFQSRCVAVFPDARGFALGSVEGRVAVHFVDPSAQRSNYAFKCHRKNRTQIFAVNGLEFHPRFGTFATCGSDGTCHFWDKDSKQRLKGFKPNRLAVPCQAFNNTGTIYAYAVSYDWHGGGKAYNRQEQNQIFLHAVKENEIMPRPAQQQRNNNKTFG